MQREIGQHSFWISNEGPVKATQLDAEALRCESQHDDGDDAIRARGTRGRAEGQSADADLVRKS